MSEPEEHLPAALARQKLDEDADVVEERLALQAQRRTLRCTPTPDVVVDFLPLNVSRGAHRASPETRQLFRDVGGLPIIRQFTELFYQKAFVDPHLDKFILHHDDPHGERFSLWIAEKFGEGSPWSDERRVRPRRTLSLEGGRGVEVAYDRSSAHFAAWHCPKREPHKWGEHFKLDDARVWMRLHFWAAREAGVLDHPAFADYYCRFIGHFVSVYSSKSPAFTRESMRWSSKPENISRYQEAGNMMMDVIGQQFETAVLELPESERVYTGSRSDVRAWPYELCR